jgi:hypothetical protein
MEAAKAYCSGFRGQWTTELTTDRKDIRFFVIEETQLGRRRDIHRSFSRAAYGQTPCALCRHPGGGEVCVHIDAS